MFNKTKKLNKKMIIFTLVLITLIANITPISKAAMITGSYDMYTIEIIDDFLINKHGYFTIIEKVYKVGDIEYPIYTYSYPTLNYSRPYTEEKIDQNSSLWQVVMHSYPYKSIEELGCKNFREAYIATQIAINCVNSGHQPSDYIPIEGNQSSMNTYNAVCKILNDTENNPISININNVTKLIKEQDDWQLDSENKEYIYKTYKADTNYEIETYKVEIENLDNAVIVDNNNVAKTEFNKGESFKVLLPIKEIKSSGEFEINITTDVKTMPLYKAISPYSEYIVTAPEYEKETVSFSQTYQENLTSINITIQELDTKIGIENSQVNLLNSNKEKISTLTTNEQGKIFIEHLLPGTYYIEQISTEEGYNVYKKQIELNMDYNKIINLTINNAEENIQNIYNKEENIIITEEITEKNINNEVTNTNINNEVNSTTENNINNSNTENNETTKTDINNQNTNTNINNKTDIKNENNTNNSYNKNDVTTESNIKNENNQTNINNKTDIKNENNINNLNTENNETNKNNSNNQNNETNISNKTDIKNENNTNNSYNKNNINNSNTQNNSAISNSHTYNSNNISKINNNETVRKLPKTGM